MRQSGEQETHRLVQRILEDGNDGQTDQQTMLKNILNGMEALVCVCDPETFEICFLNDSIRKNFGIEGSGVGHLCHQLLQGLNQPCRDCPHRQLLKEPDKPVIWEHRESIKDSILRKTALMIDWGDGRKRHLEYAIDITGLVKAQESLKQREKMLDVLNRSAIILLSQGEGNFRETMAEGCCLLCGAMGLGRLSIWKNFPEPDGSRFSRVYQWDRESGGSERSAEVPADAELVQLAPRLESLLASGESINGPTRLMPESVQPMPSGRVSILANPIFIHNIFWGFVLFEDCVDERVFTEEEADILRSASLMLSSAIIRNEGAKAVREVGRRMAEQAHWYKSILDAMPLPVFVMDMDMRWTFVNRATEAMLGKTSAEILGKPCQSSNIGICDADQFGIAYLKRGVKQTFFSQDDALYQVDVDSLRDLSGETTGHILVVQDITKIEGMVRQQKEMEENLSRLKVDAEKIFYDPLTGIHNRRFFNENIDRLLGVLSRSSGVLSLMMVDIDHFKQYNDTYGHIDGDSCLKTVAWILGACTMRKGDFVARYGGEEFVLVLPNVEEAGARRIAEKLLDEVRNSHIPHSRSDAGRVTISIGVVIGKVQPTHGKDDYLRRADEMLYESKRGGRDRYTFSTL